MKRISFSIVILFVSTFVTFLSIAPAQPPPPYPGAQQNQGMAEAIRTVAKSTVSSLKSLTEKGRQAAKTEEEKKKADAQLQDLEKALKMLDRMKVTVYVTGDPLDKVKSFYEEKLKVTFKSEEKPMEELANGLKLNGFDGIQVEDFKGLTIRRLTSIDKAKKLEIEIDDKGIDPSTGKLVQKTIINFVSFSE